MRLLLLLLIACDRGDSNPPRACNGETITVRGRIGDPAEACWEDVVLELPRDAWLGYCDAWSHDCGDVVRIWATADGTCFRQSQYCQPIDLEADPWIVPCSDVPACCDGTADQWEACP